jgi:flagellar hook-associated protein 1
MSDLLSLLNLGSAGIAAQNSGVGVASRNVANVNTAGYSRQRVDLQAMAGYIGGVRAGSPDRINDSLLGMRMRTAAGSLSMSSTMSNAIGDLEARLVNRGPSIDESIGGFMSRLQQVAATPTDGTMRDAAVESINEMISGIRERSEELASALAESNQRIRDNAKQAADLAKRLADANKNVAKTNDPVLRDERDRIASSLSELVGGSARVDADGKMRFVLDGGAVLVDGSQAASIETKPDPTTGNETILVGTGTGKRDVTSALGGKLGADARFRDGTLATASNDLDQLAFDMATSMNAVHAGNVALDGSTGRNLFTAPGAVKGAAANLELDPAIAADSDLLATRGPGGGVGDNAGALALLGAGQPFADKAIDMIAKIATEGARARSDVKRDSLVNDHLVGLHDSISGVDIQEELANLSKFQHASAAMTSFVSTIDQMLGNLIDRL